jgi:hypothetical protein
MENEGEENPEQDATFLWILEPNTEDFLKDQQKKNIWNIENLDHVT